MNRDERIARGAGNLPELHQVAGVRALYPSDGASNGEEGTWIACNEFGITLALLNWNEPVTPLPTKARSRGALIPSLAGSRTLGEVQAAMNEVDLSLVKPFRLAGIFPGEQTVREWRWDARNLEPIDLPWKSQHWFSSSLGDDRALHVRGATCRDAWKEPDAGSSDWLRKLHSFHDPAGAIGPCVHRDDVRTLTFTEIQCTDDRMAMRHFVGNPCAAGDLQLSEIRRAPALQSF